MPNQLHQTPYTIIFPDGTTKDLSAELPSRPSFSQLKTIINPIISSQPNSSNNFEHVSVLGPDGTPTDMFVDELGALIPLPVNLEATKHYHRAVLRRMGEKGDRVIADADLIYGAAVFFPKQVWF